MGRKVENKATKVEETSKNNYEDSLQAIAVASTGDSARLVVLHGDVNEASISIVVAQLLHLASQNHKPIHLVISTYGGSVDEMFMLYDTIKFLPCPVHTIALGKVMSAGVLLLAAGTKGQRKIGKHCRVMIHSVLAGNEGPIHSLENEMNEIRWTQDRYINALIAETKLTQTTMKKLLEKHVNIYLSAEEAVKYGIADEVI